MVRVGENGPENLFLPKGATVSPLGSGGGGQVFQNTFNLYGSTQEQAQQIAQYLDNQLRLRGAF